MGEQDQAGMSDLPRLLFEAGRSPESNRDGYEYPKHFDQAIQKLSELVEISKMWIKVQPRLQIYSSMNRPTTFIGIVNAIPNASPVLVYLSIISQARLFII